MSYPLIRAVGDQNMLVLYLEIVGEVFAQTAMYPGEKGQGQNGCSDSDPAQTY